MGVTLGVLQKWLDATAANTLPLLLQRMDIGNYFGRLAIWFLLGTAVSVYSGSPLRAGVNTFCFFISMVAGYYLYCHYVLGFLPRSYMMIWVLMSFASYFLAMVCWYAKGEGAPAVLLSAVILGALLAQAVNLRIDRGFYVYHLMESLHGLPCAASAQKRKGICGGDGAVRCGGGLVSAHPAALGMTPQPNKNPTEESPAGSFFWAGQSFPAKLRKG